ncbi:MAG: hypothetical protein A3B31_03075 [Candidatus Komeilibacteria bacterium RIFCSPLOWO2_01_FULL_53_11]|uniref:Uncharacterized protein n=1 Tax=Candidatus Komeilibacteria bacterium RIFCSPLOWO2_01_FULL_53_11 TaxID=1798552 RepID=A0A1G2BQW3_9BACT|nr:MAG: hypothetical protein A3B31_03075 [Candidatus Komeilibacteria bacterium RIFCSPLOWO2_01_FULL_53_11]
MSGFAYSQLGEMLLRRREIKLDLWLYVENVISLLTRSSYSAIGVINLQRRIKTREDMFVLKMMMNHFTATLLKRSWEEIWSPARSFIIKTDVKRTTGFRISGFLRIKKHTIAFIRKTLVDMVNG